MKHGATRANRNQNDEYLQLFHQVREFDKTTATLRPPRQQNSTAAASMNQGSSSLPEEIVLCRNVGHYEMRRSKTKL